MRDTGEIQARYRRDLGEIHARYMRDLGEMYARSRRDLGEMYARSRRDLGEMWRASLCARRVLMASQVLMIMSNGAKLQRRGEVSSGKVPPAGVTSGHPSGEVPRASYAGELSAQGARRGWQPAAAAPLHAPLDWTAIGGYATPRDGSPALALAHYPGGESACTRRSRRTASHSR